MKSKEQKNQLSILKYTDVFQSDISYIDMSFCNDKNYFEKKKKKKILFYFL